MIDSTPLLDRSAEPQPEPCARHWVAAVFIVRTEVCEGTTAQHLIEHVTAQLLSGTPDLHEDIYDELTDALRTVTGHELLPPSITRACLTCCGLGYVPDDHERLAACPVCQGRLVPA